MSEDVWDEMVEKYAIQGYDNSTVLINYQTLLELAKKSDILDKMPQMIRTSASRNTELKKKLVDIKHELMRVTPVLSSLGKTYGIHYLAFPNLVKAMWNAIDEEDPRTVQCKSCSDVCRAWITIEGECPPLEAEG